MPIIQDTKVKADQQAKSADEFDKGFNQQALSGLKVGEKGNNGSVVEHTFFGGDGKQGLNMLVSEQKQLEKMEAYNF